MPSEITPKRRYSETDKLKAVTIYLTIGNLAETARQTEIPYLTLRDWLDQSWYPQMVATIRGEQNTRISAKYKAIVEKTQDKLLERIEKGDIILRGDGEFVPIPIKGRDLAAIVNVASSQAQQLDAKTYIPGENLTIGDRLTKIAEELIKMHNNKAKPVIDVEIIPDAVQ